MNGLTLRGIEGGQHRVIIELTPLQAYSLTTVDHAARELYCRGRAVAALREIGHLPPGGHCMPFGLRVELRQLRIANCELRIENRSTPWVIEVGYCAGLN